MTLLLIATVSLFALAAFLALDATFQVTFNHGQDVITNSVTITGDSKDYAEITLAAASTTNVVLAIDPDAIKGYVFVSDVAATLTTTNASGVADVITMVANEPLVWHHKMAWANGHFANRAAWTNLAFAVAGATAGTLKYLVIRDGTP